jgi:hypothetical protein
MTRQRRNFYILAEKIVWRLKGFLTDIEYCYTRTPLVLINLSKFYKATPLSALLRSIESNSGRGQDKFRTAQESEGHE